MTFISTAAMQSFADGCLKATEPDDVSLPLTTLLANVGINSWYAGHLVHESELSRHGGFGFFGMVPGWREHYARARHSDHDAVFRYALQHDRATTWSQCRERVQAIAADETPRALRVFDEAKDFGLRDGFIKPIRSSGEIPAAVTFGGFEVDRSPEGLACLEMVAAWTFEGFRRVFQGFKPVAPYLTPRELEVLRWTAAGKSAWEISEILAIAETTVRDHHKSLRRKYGVSTLIRVAVLATFNRTLTFIPSPP